MPVQPLDFAGNPNIGVFAAATDKDVLLPPILSNKAVKIIENVLKVPAIRTNLCGSNLIGVFSVGNNNGLVVSRFALNEEIKFLKERIKSNVEPLPDKHTAVGNLVLANDYGAIANPLLSKTAIKVLEETLGVEVVKGTIAKMRTIGSVAVATNKGVLAHPNATEEELKWLEEILKVPANVGTVNRGTPYVGACMIANVEGAVVGSLTTGPELARIEDTLGFL
ncbi:MAG: translation initiation factor IF-6 [Euryarchaeota archaeon]|nr:translation initiation factor IF-6 [Euryarchaeota archaeon]